MYSMYICVCNAVTDKAIKKAICNGACSVSDLTQQLNVGSCCGKCKSCAFKILKEIDLAPKILLNNIKPESIALY